LTERWTIVYGKVDPLHINLPDLLTILLQVVVGFTRGFEANLQLLFMVGSPEDGFGVDIKSASICHNLPHFVSKLRIYWL